MRRFTVKSYSDSWRSILDTIAHLFRLAVAILLVIFPASTKSNAKLPFQLHLEECEPNALSPGNGPDELRPRHQY